jgi:hypothetical protein
MSKREFKRLEVLLQVQSGRLRIADTCELIGIVVASLIATATLAVHHTRYRKLAPVGAAMIFRRSSGTQIWHGIEAQPKGQGCPPSATPG